MEEGILVYNQWIKHNSSGIIEICFNLRAKHIIHHRYTDTKYCFYIEDEYGSTAKEQIVDIEEFKKEGIKYLCTELREKDQVIFYYIPYELFDLKIKSK